MGRLFRSGGKDRTGPAILFSCIHRHRYSAWVSTDYPQSLWKSGRGRRKNDGTFRRGGESGYRRLHVLPRREGWRVHHKLVYWSYKEEGPEVRTKKRRKRV